MVKFYKVTDETLSQTIHGFFDQMESAKTEFLKFSRRQGGSRNRLGIARSWFGYYPSVYFAKEPDRTIWKKANKDSNDFWEPKACKAAKQIRDEFNSLAKAFPSRGTVYDALGYEPMANGFAGFETYGDVCVFGMRDDFKPNKKQSKKIERISDLEYEELLARANT